MKPFTMKYLLLTIFFFTMIKTNAQDQFSVLLFTQHDTWHYNTIPVAVKAFEDMAAENQFQFDWTQRPDDLIEKLPEYDVVIFMNANANFLTTKHMDALKAFMKRGGGFVGIHGTADGENDNAWFDGLVGAKFVDHPKLQAAIVNVENSDFPATWHLPKKWLRSDEWYNFKNMNLDKLTILMTVDETSYDFTAGYDDIPLKGMGAEHPISWYQEYEGGRSFYTALGHKPESFKDKNFLDHIFGAIYWVQHK
ncbi:ThuA domain-containing protein [Algibacter sp. L4_22]|uniref:ThuA domain-containing protein n=1 Tax=Algibacter sp. L4_22 TaxID=2942477 RepID=UPI00201B8C84|nr:ThuA domain-containing protein [Algibacter sp. L4_22]MCL5130007.1 ThuA domain-containing protein [Algibacter sp. L4_22]